MYNILLEHKYQIKKSFAICEAFLFIASLPPLKVQRRAALWQLQ